MNNIRMQSNVLEVLAITRKTSARFFKDVKVGDRIMFYTDIKWVGRSQGGNYATNITVVDVGSGRKYTKSMTMMSNILASFELADTK